MPIYEYRCESCAYELEKLQKMSDPTLVDCPECSRPALRRLISAAAFRLKGSGWYETDFKHDNKRNLAETSGKDSSNNQASGSTDKKADKPSSGSSNKLPDVKPASKPVAKESKNA